MSKLTPQRGSVLDVSYAFPDTVDFTGYTALFNVYTALNGTVLTSATDVVNANGDIVTFTGSTINLHVSSTTIDALPLATDTTQPNLLRFDLFISGDDDEPVKLDGGYFVVLPLGSPVQGAPQDISVILGATTYDITVYGALQGAPGGGVQPSAVLDADNTGATDAGPTINTALLAFGSAGGILYIPGGTYLIATGIRIPDKCQIIGAGMDYVTFKVSAALSISTQIIRQVTNVSTSAVLVAPGLVIQGITFDGSLRVFPVYLSKADGTPITDPEADYRAGGCLAPTSLPTAHAVITGGKITSIVADTIGSGVIGACTVWITGDGFGATARGTLNGTGGVASYTIQEGGFGYTTATIEVVGGGADPRTALYAADRRNPDYAIATACIGFNKADKPLVKECRFYRYGGNCINDAGSDYCIVEDCEFIECGQIDFVGMCLWSQNNGTVGGASYRESTNTIFRRNYVKDQKRSAALLQGNNPQAYENTIDGWKEATFLTGPSKNAVIRDNFAKNGDISDLTCMFVASRTGGNLTVTGNTIESCNAPLALITCATALFSRNTFKVTAPVAVGKYPFGPFTERIGVGFGNAALAGTNRATDLLSSMFVIYDIDGDPANAPDGIVLRDNVLDDPNGYLRYFVNFNRGATTAIGDVVVEGNSTKAAPYVTMFDPVRADISLGVNNGFRMMNNPGHVSMGAVMVTETIASGSSGTHKVTFGFRPRVLHVKARLASDAVIGRYDGIFVDQASRLPGTTGSTNLSGGAMTLSSTGSTHASSDTVSGGISVPNASGTAVLVGTAIGFNSDGWSFAITTSTADVHLQYIAVP